MLFNVFFGFFESFLHVVQLPLQVLPVEVECLQLLCVFRVIVVSLASQGLQLHLVVLLELFVLLLQVIVLVRILLQQALLYHFVVVRDDGYPLLGIIYCV